MQIDDSAARLAENELRDVLSSLPPHTLNNFADIFDVLAEKAEDLFVIDGKGVSALRAPEDVVFLKPSALFGELIKAIRIRAAKLDIRI
jgi:hypothetical protein